jgi:hypothetical protein
MLKHTMLPLALLTLILGTFYVHHDAEAFLTKKMKARQEARKEGRAAKKECRANGGSRGECRAVKKAAKNASKAASGVFNPKKTAKFQARADGFKAKAECKAAGQKGCNKLKRAVINESKLASGLFSDRQNARFQRRADRLRGKFDAKNGLAEQGEGEEGGEEEPSEPTEPEEFAEEGAEEVGADGFEQEEMAAVEVQKSSALRGRYADQLENRNLAANQCASEGGVYRFNKCEFGLAKQFGRGAQGRSIGGMGFAGRGNAMASPIGAGNSLQGRSAFNNPRYQAYAQGRMAQRVPAASRFAKRPLIQPVQAEPAADEMESEAVEEDAGEVEEE